MFPGGKRNAQPIVGRQHYVYKEWLLPPLRHPIGPLSQQGYFLAGAPPLAMGKAIKFWLSPFCKSQLLVLHFSALKACEVHQSNLDLKKEFALQTHAVMHIFQAYGFLFKFPVAITPSASCFFPNGIVIIIVGKPLKLQYKGCSIFPIFSFELV